MTLETGIFLKRYKRFFADVKLPSSARHGHPETVDADAANVAVAHVPNTGSLRSCLTPGCRCAFSRSKNPDRKLALTLELLQNADGTWIGVNTLQANRLVEKLLIDQVIAEWRGVKYRREVVIGAHTRLDFQVGERFLEVKNVTWVEDGVALFPDAVTERGAKHVRELIELKAKGFAVEVVFVVQRSDAKKLQIASQLDPNFAQVCSEALKAGVGFRALRFECSLEGIQYKNEIPVGIAQAQTKS